MNSDVDDDAVDVENLISEMGNNYCQTSDIRGTLVGYEIDDHSDVIGALPVGAAPTNLHSRLNTWL